MAEVSDNGQFSPGDECLALLATNDNVYGGSDRVLIGEVFDQV